MGARWMDVRLLASSCGGLRGGPILVVEEKGAIAFGLRPNRAKVDNNVTVTVR